MLKRSLLLAAFSVSSVSSVSLAASLVWVNETNQASEADYCNLQFPSSMSVAANSPTPVIYGRLYEAGLTEAGGAPANTFADVGYGPSGSDPRTDPNWTWFPATYNVQVGNDDEYQGSITAPAYNGTYSYTYRFSIDNGATFTAADLNGAGANAGLTFETSQLGVMTVTGGLDIPEPACGALMAAIIPMLVRRRRA